MRFSDDKIVGLDWTVGGQTVTWGVKCDYSCKLERPVRSIEISCHGSDKDGPFRWITFFDEEGKQISRYFWLYTSFYPETYPETKLTIQDGYDLIGFAIATDETGAITCINFTAMKRNK